MSDASGSHSPNHLALPPARRNPGGRRAVEAFAWGVPIGTLGGLIGLGGAEFRLPGRGRLATDDHRVVRTSFLLCSLVALLLTACRAADSESRSAPPSESSPGSASPCPASVPAWAEPPEDSAVPDAPGFGRYFLNADQSIWASASWTRDSERHLRVGDRGVKVGWFRPAGAPLEITGQRLDAPSPPLVATIPCCYPTRFQATSLLFPTGGCWEITAKAAASVLSFVVRVSDEEPTRPIATDRRPRA